MKLTALRSLLTEPAQQNSLRSVLDEIPGIGPARKKALLTEFGSVEVFAGFGKDILKCQENRSLAEQILRSFNRTVL